MAVKVKDFKYVRPDLNETAEFLTKAIASIKAAKSAQEIIDIRENVNKKLNSVGTNSALAYIRHSLDVNDEFYAKEQDYFDENYPAVVAKSSELNRAIVESPFIGEIEKLLNPLIIKGMKAQVRVMDDRIVEDCVEENKLVSEYDQLRANLKFKWNGKDITLSELLKYTKSKDRAERKRAFTVLGETLEAASDKLDGIFDKLVKVRDRKAKKMGFKNFVEMGNLAMGHVDYDRNDVKVFRESVLNDVVPTLTRLKTELAKRLGIDAVHIYDNDAYIVGGNIDPEGSATDLFEAAQSIYDDMDPALGSFFKEMRDAEAFDYEARSGKGAGGYAEIIYDYGQPFIFANFNGTMDDVGVLTHEFGHAYAFKRAYENKIDTDIFVGGMETAETHSMAMEQLCTGYNDRFYGKRAKEATYQQLFDAFNFLPYGVIVDYFQELVYENPDMTPKERKSLWLKLESEYRPYVDMSDVPYINIGGRWQYQHHIFESPFYYIDYCLSTCMALQFGELAEKDFGDALKRYLNFVEAGGTKDINTLAHEAGFNSPFDKGALKGLAGEVAKHIENIL